jgi:hypothetical protein
MRKSDLLTQISVFDIRGEIDRYLGGAANVVRGETIDRLVGEYDLQYEMRACGGISQIK